MTLIEQRDPAFWASIMEHPAVKPCVVLSGDLPDLTSMVTDPHVEPWASEHGGFLFFRRDGLGRMWELHTMFTPEGWGREVATAAREAAERLFLRGGDVIYTVEVRGNERSRPPLSHGWRAAGPFAFAPELAAEVRTWVLTREGWESSPARRRHLCP